MPRLRQQNPGNYGSSTNISAEFENVIRYLTRAELGDKTLGELMATIFDESGEFAGPISIRLDPTEGLQYRVGSYDDETAGWTQIVTTSALRGAPGVNVGSIGAPIIYNRADYTATSGQTAFNYAFDATDDLLVYVNGILMTPTVDYAKNPATDTITFTTPRTAGQTVSIYSIRASSITGYNRVDTVTVAPQAVFPFVHSDSDELQVYKNGILQREGGSFDYTRNPATDTITFNSAIPGGNVVTILTVQNTSVQTVTGLLMEADYTDLSTGLIRFDRISVANDQIPQAKVADLTTALNRSAKIIISATTPTGDWLQSGRLWLDISQTPNILKFHNGVTWLATSPESSLPPFSTSEALKYARINATGTGFVYDTIDLSNVVAISQKGAANGVATLDATGRIPTSQLPAALGAESIYTKLTAAVANGTYTSKRIFKQKIQVVGMSFQCASGSATIQLAVNGVGIGATYTVNPTGSDVPFTVPQQIDAMATNQRVGFIVSSASALADLEVTISAQVLP